MTASIVQQNGGQSTALNPTLAFPKRVGAGNYLLAVLLQRSSSMPQLADNLGNAWEMIGCTANNDNTVMLCAYRVRSAKAGNTTVTFPTDAPSGYALQEIAGVPADQNAGTDNAALWPDSYSAAMAPGTTHAVQATPGGAGALCEAIIACFGSVIFTNTDATWVAGATFANSNISMQLLTKVGGPGAVVAHWTTPADVEVAMMALSLG